MIRLSSEIGVSLPQLMDAAYDVYVEETAEDMRSGVLHD
jgi:L-ribulose-5-phosphate 3-epimerase UlaE